MAGSYPKPGFRQPGFFAFGKRRSGGCLLIGK